MKNRFTFCVASKEKETPHEVRQGDNSMIPTEQSQ